MKIISVARYRFFKYGFIVLLLLLGYTIFANYNYMMFKTLIADNYIFTDTLAEWYEQTLGAENVNGFRRNFDDVVIAAVTEKIRSYNQDRYTYLYTPQHYRLSREMEKADAATAHVEALSAATVYMNLPNISDGTKDFVMNHKEELAHYQNLVLDLRSNYGGMLKDFYEIAELFVQKGNTLGYEKTRFPIWPFSTHAVKSNRETYFSFRRIAVLQNENTASSAEGLILALQGNLSNTTVIGKKSFGKGIGQVTIPLTDDFAVKATVLLVSGPNDNSIHQVGIEPDILYEKEDIISFALKTIES